LILNSVQVFVLGDGGESDLDLGNYERFLDIQLTKEHNITTGKIYREVIARERRGDYLGKTVQVVPHITNEIQDWIERVAQVPVDDSGEPADVCLIEVGGTVGDIESSIFFEALRQFQFRVGNDNFCLMFVSLVPILSNEQKTKPTQHGVKSLMSLGLSPKVIFCRCPLPLEQACKDKISAFCHVSADNVISVHDVNNVYHVPLLLMQQKLHHIIAKELNLGASMEVENPDMKDWSAMAYSLDGFTDSVKIALIGKYNGLQDAYLSIIKSLKHASIACDRKLDLVWVEASQLESKDNEHYEANWEKIKSADGVIVPGGFGTR
jgi:CTP synthase